MIVVDVAQDMAIDIAKDMTKDMMNDMSQDGSEGLEDRIDELVALLNTKAKEMDSLRMFNAKLVAKQKVL